MFFPFSLLSLLIKGSRKPPKFLHKPLPLLLELGLPHPQNKIPRKQGVAQPSWKEVGAAEAARVLSAGVGGDEASQHRREGVSNKENGYTFFWFLLPRFSSGDSWGRVLPAKSFRILFRPAKEGLERHFAEGRQGICSAQRKGNCHYSPCLFLQQVPFDEAA